MGFLSLFSKSRPAAATLQRLPSGSMTVDRHGVIVMTTVPSSYPQEILKQVANEVLRLFREARAAQLPLSEMTIQYSSFSISAREMHGGAFIFLQPKTSFTSLTPT
jgi:hypothetical protein